MNFRRSALAFAVLLLAFVAWFLWPLREQTAGPFVAAPPAPTPPAGQAAAAKSEIPSPAPPLAPAERSPLADQLNAPASDIRADLRLVADIVATFRSNFPRAGNPVGSNPEITAALTGKNPLHLALIPPDHPAINARGELCDRWGTPFFFHAESGTRMAIRSAGPDKKMWTDDDVVFAP